MTGAPVRALRIEGPLSVPALLDTLREIVARRPALRAVAARPRIHRCGPGEHVLHLGVHPVVAGHGTLAVLLDELLATFRGEEPGPVPDDPAADAAGVGAAGVGSAGVGSAGVGSAGVGSAGVGSAEHAWDYWRERLAGPLGVLELATGQDRAAATGRAVAVPDLAAGPLDAVTLLAGIQALLRRYCGVTDVLLGLPVALDGLRSAETSAENTVVLRGDLAGDPSVADLLAATARAFDEALEHRALPIGELVHRLSPAGSTGVAQPFQVAVTLDTLVLPGFGAAAADFALGETGPVVTAGAVRVQPVALAERALAAPLTFVATVGRDRPRVTLLHDPALLPAEFCAGLASDLSTVVAGMAAGGPVARLLPRAVPEARGGPDPARVHRTDPDFTPFDLADLDGSLVDRFVRLAARHGDRPAVLTAGATVTYRELATRAAAIAAALREADAGADTRVALLLDHGPEAVAAILGVLSSGAAYVPLDPAYPVDRLAYMLGHAEAGVVVTTGNHRALLTRLCDEGPAPRVVDLGEVRPGVVPASPATADSPAYILYTSGSTGRPKGVVQTHRNVLFQVRNHTNNLRIAAGDRVSLLSSFSFDMAVTDMFSALLNGAAVVPLDLRGDLAGLAGALTGLGVTVYHSTPTVYRHLLGTLADGGTLPGLRAVVLGGEPVTWEDVERSRTRLPAGSVLVNGYGATEVSFAAQHHVPLAAATARTGVVPIGHPLDGIEVVLLAPDGRPAVLHGEIGIRSRYVSAGYWRDPDLNRRKFRVHDDGTRTYRTGDLGRRLPDGTLAYLGRGDRQVKVHGYRVELGEIEAVLHADPAVGQAVAVANGTGLVAYVEGARADPAALRARLAETLPHFMVPRAIVAMAALPLTPTGKVDVRALPAPAPTRPRSPAPDGPVESAIAEAWCHVLGVPAVGREDNFFEAGGHSLLLAGVQQRLADRLGPRIPLTAMLEHPTVAALAGFLNGRPDESTVLGAVHDRMSRRRQARGAR